MSKRHGPEEAFDDAPLFDDPKPRARNSDPWTSHAAAASMAEESKRQRSAILGALRQNAEGLTVDEIAAQIGSLDRVQVGRRMVDLRGLGQIADSGHVRVNGNGRSVIVWIPT